MIIRTEGETAGGSSESVTKEYGYLLFGSVADP
jgi:hypothetical protein